MDYDYFKLMGMWCEFKNRKNRKPFKWYWHWLLCELGWRLRNVNFSIGWGLYYKHLDKMCKLGWNYYGEKIIPWKHDPMDKWWDGNAKATN